MGFLSAIGKDVKKVFSWLGSSKGQAVIASGEAIASAIDPGLTPLLNIGNTWLTEIIKTEAIATAAGQQDGSGTQKSAAVLSTVVPEILAFAQSQKMTVPSSARIQAVNDTLVAFLNEFGVPGSASTPAVGSVSPAASNAQPAALPASK